MFASSFMPDYYVLQGRMGSYEAADVVALFDGMDHYEAWAVGDALAYLVRAGRKTKDPTEDLGKARNSLTMALDHREARRNGGVI